MDKVCQHQRGEWADALDDLIDRETNVHEASVAADNVAHGEGR